MTKASLIRMIDTSSVEKIDDYLDSLGLNKQGNFISMKDFILYESNLNDYLYDFSDGEYYWVNKNHEYIWVSNKEEFTTHDDLFSGDKLSEMVDIAVGLDNVLEKINEFKDWDVV